MMRVDQEGADTGCPGSLVIIRIAITDIESCVRRNGELGEHLLENARMWLSPSELDGGHDMREKRRDLHARKMIMNERRVVGVGEDAQAILRC